MLVITRRPKQSFIIETENDTIRVTLLGIYGNQARIAIEAEPNVFIVREELIGRLPNNRSNKDDKK